MLRLKIQSSVHWTPSVFLTFTLNSSDLRIDVISSSLSKLIFRFLRKFHLLAKSLSLSYAVLELIDLNSFIILESSFSILKASHVWVFDTMRFSSTQYDLFPEADLDPFLPVDCAKLSNGHFLLFFGDFDSSFGGISSVTCDFILKVWIPSMISASESSSFRMILAPERLLETLLLLLPILLFFTPSKLHFQQIPANLDSHFPSIEYAKSSSFGVWAFTLF